MRPRGTAGAVEHRVSVGIAARAGDEAATGAPVHDLPRPFRRTPAVARRRSMYLDRPSARRSSYSSYSSSYGRHQGGGFLRKVAIALVLLLLVLIGAGAYQWTRDMPAQQVNA